MRLVEIARREAAGRVRLVGRFESARDGERLELYFEYPERYGDFLGESADPFAAAMLLPAMRRNEPLRLDFALSPRLHFHLPRIRDVFCTWYPQFPRVEIQAPADPAAPPARAPHAATFFSGGVDSFYSLLKYRAGGERLPAPLTHVLFMRGLETKLERIRGAEASLAQVHEIARAVGVECLDGESNLRSPSRLHYENYYYGSALAACALSLAGGLGYVCIPSGYAYVRIIPHGSSPLTDEMYSTERCQVVHDGAERTRPEKLEKALEWDRELVLRHLRVCIENRGGAYNCGRCYKCVRTAILLKALGAWADARTFPDKRTDHWERVIADDHFWITESNLGFAEARGAPAEVIALLRRVVRRRHRREALRALATHTAPPRLLPVLRAAASRFG